MAVEKRLLGRTELEVTPLGLGCWQFSGGRGLIGGFWEALPQERVVGVVEAALAGGMNWFDTAEAYGWGASEEALSAALKTLGKKPGEVIIATKWHPTFRRASSLRTTLEDRLRHLGGFPVDLHQVHHPTSLATVQEEMRVMAGLLREGKIRAVGVSNYAAGMMRRAHQALQKHGLALASNQIRYSLLDRQAERNGVLAAAKELGITIIAYSPLAQGILTARLHADPASIRLRPGPRKWLPRFRERGLARTRPLVEALEEIGRAHGATPGQVALAWVIRFHGPTVVAIPGASRPEQVRENAGALDLALTPRELARLDELSRPFSGL